MPVLFLLSLTLQGQYDHIAVHSEKEGLALETALIADFTPAMVLDLSEAKDTLYRRIFLHKDSVRCVYTGWAKFLNLNEDPSIYLFQNGGNEDINLEHGFPQSKGASSGNAQSDMHHLFPARVPVNTARANDPYREITDSNTDNWYYKNVTQSNIPSSNRDSYSEDVYEGFEPREDFKGNVARAYFYFFTIYRQEAELKDPAYFEFQRTTLCDWHERDPVDSLEWNRTQLIASYQDGKANPFVLDCSLARLYCNDISVSCKSVKTHDENQPSISLENSCVRAGGTLFLSAIENKGPIWASIYMLDGRCYSKKQLAHSFQLEAPEIPGMFILVLKNNNTSLLTTKFCVN